MAYLDNLPDLNIKSKVVVQQTIQIKSVVKYIKNYCPKCQSPKQHVYSSSRNNRIRYHKCDDCGYLFRSIEVEQ